jgi:hypothetical protein
MRRFVRYRHRPHRHRSCSPDVTGGQGVVSWLQREPIAQASSQPRRGAFNCRCKPSRPTPPTKQGHKRTERHSRASKPQRQPGQAQPQHTQARNTNKQQHDTNKGESSHTSLIPSSFRVKRLGSAQREQHDRIQAS